jgi:hypothetical protein
MGPVGEDRLDEEAAVWGPIVLARKSLKNEPVKGYAAAPRAGDAA